MCFEWLVVLDGAVEACVVVAPCGEAGLVSCCGAPTSMAAGVRSSRRSLTEPKRVELLAVPLEGGGSGGGMLLVVALVDAMPCAHTSCEVVLADSDWVVTFAMECV